MSGEIATFSKMSPFALYKRFFRLRVQPGTTSVNQLPRACKSVATSCFEFICCEEQSSHGLRGTAIEFGTIRYMLDELSRGLAPMVVDPKRD
jgi:hypothetical protein